MRILSLQVLPGANVYSLKPILKVKLDIGDLADTPSNELPFFNKRLIALLPQLKEHHCSRGYPGGFWERLQEGTYLAHIFEHIALELQALAGYENNFGKARGTAIAGIYDVVIGYEIPAAAIAATRTTEALLKAVLAGENFNIEEAVLAVKQAGMAAELGPSTAAIYEAAVKRRIPVRRIGEEDLLYLGYGKKMRRIWTTITGETGVLAADLASDKELTKKILASGGLPVPRGVVATSLPEAWEAVKALCCPVVIKPVCGNQGKGVTLNVVREAEVERAFQIAAGHDKRVVVEEYVAGRQYRICVVNGKMAAAAERIPAYIVGDGMSSVKQLVDAINADPNRGDDHERPLTKIQMDAIAIMVLSRQGLTLQSVLPAGAVIYVRDSANLSTGGTAVDVTDIVHPENAFIAQRAAALIGLDVAGVDLVTEDIAKPIAQNGGAIIEINAAPGIRMHHYPSAGKPRDVAAAIVDYLFPNGDDGRIPLVAITGTNGKTTTTRMVGHILQQAGYTVGMTTTEGVFVGQKQILTGDTTGPVSARAVLADPNVEAAVLETARGGILRGGLGYDCCDVGVITNVTDDHFGQDGIDNLEDLMYVKSLVVETVRPGGFSLLNADDPCVTALASRAKGVLVYFTTEADNLIVRRHLSIGGQAFFVKDGVIYMASGNLAQMIVKVSDIPVTLGGIAQHNVQNAVVAAAACGCLKVPPAAISYGLSTFEENPGRLNMFSLGEVKICVDYGHNPAGYQALINTVRRLGVRRVVGVIAVPGDRRDDVIINTGRIAGRGFDCIYIKEDEDLRGREPGETASLLERGVLEGGLSPEKVKTVLAEEAAVLAALAEAKPGDIIVVFYEKFNKVMAVIDDYRQKAVTEYNQDYFPNFTDNKIPASLPI